MLRFFVVGCPRSGTTLVQTLLLSTDSLVSFPESHFFQALGNASRRIPPGIVGTRLLNRWLDSAGATYRRRSWVGFTRAAAIKYFWTSLDGIASAHFAKGWLEKTPNHVQHIDVIQEHVPDAKFIHVLRSYEDNIASLYLAQRHWGEQSTPLATARSWFDHVSRSLSYLGLGNHCHISYDQLVSHPSLVVDQLSSFTGLCFPDAELIDLRRYAERVVEGNATWKARNLESRRISATSRRFGEVFAPEEQREIRSYVHAVSKWLATTSD